MELDTDFSILRILAENTDEFVAACKSKIINAAAQNGHDMNDILQHYYHSNSKDISYLIYCKNCQFEITLEYISIADTDENINIVGELNEKCGLK